MTDFSPTLSPEQARMLSPLQLAYVGDSVHALIVRTGLLQKNLLVKDMHRASNEAVSAVSQAKELTRLLPLLTDEEADIVRRGRNAHPRHSAPKSASTADYAGATGLEALLGYLYLTGQNGRIQELTPFLVNNESAEYRVQSTDL
ncbi:MAG: Mini-ribonuclease 3 [Clostridia bacterium]|nr:Mini-ribonuclease 3 [Clostridia bacterium]